MALAFRAEREDLGMLFTNGAEVRRSVRADVAAGAARATTRCVMCRRLEMLEATTGVKRGMAFVLLRDGPAQEPECYDGLIQIQGRFSGRHASSRAACAACAGVPASRARLVDQATAAASSGQRRRLRRS